MYDLPLSFYKQNPRARRDCGAGKITADLLNACIRTTLLYIYIYIYMRGYMCKLSVFFYKKKGINVGGIYHRIILPYFV